MSQPGLALLFCLVLVQEGAWRALGQEGLRGQPGPKGGGESWGSRLPGGLDQDKASYTIQKKCTTTFTVGSAIPVYPKLCYPPQLYSIFNALL